MHDTEAMLRGREHFRLTVYGFAQLLQGLNLSWRAADNYMVAS